MTARTTTTINGIALGRAHARRLRDVYRSAGWPCLDSVEVELLAAAQQGWLDQKSLRGVALAHGVCPYYLGQEMVKWVDVVVGDYNYYFDRSAILYALTSNNNWRIAVLVDEYLSEHATDAPGAWLPFYFQTLAFSNLAEEFGEHSLCELRDPEAAITLRNIVPAHFIAPRVAAADSMVLFSATLNPTDYYTNLLGLPDTTQRVDVASPFAPDQLAVVIKPLSTRRDDRLATLDDLVDAIAEQFARQSGNYLAFFSSFDYLELALQRLQTRHPGVPVWSQQRQMGESSRHAFLQQFDVAGQGVGFAVLGGVFGEGVDLPGKRLIGAFIATLGLPQFDEVNQAICQRMQSRFGRGYDYTYVFPGLQKVVQAAGRVIRTQSDTGTVVLLDERYREYRYRQLLPGWWKHTSQ